MRRANALLLTTDILSSARFTRPDLRRRKWLLPPCVRTTMPVPVTRKRLAVALCVFSLYFFFVLFATSILLRLLFFLAQRSQDHEHIAPFHIRVLLNLSDICQQNFNFVQGFSSQMRMGDFTSPKTHPDTYLHPGFQP